MSLLAFRGVRVTLGERQVLAGVELALEAGEVLALAGPNGAGKTTLLRVASRVIPLAAGRVELGGRDAASLSQRELARRLAVVPQDAVVAFPFRVIEVVLMGRSPHLGWLGFESEADVALARDSLRRVGIEGLADRSVFELSGGERQLVLLARALVQEPRVLLLDEPTAHLDLRHRIEVLRLVRDFVASGERGALVVSHDLSLAAAGCDRIALLAGGRVLANGTPPSVLTPETLRAAFDIEADVATAPDGSPLVVPRGVRGPQAC